MLKYWTLSLIMTVPVISFADAASDLASAKAAIQAVAASATGDCANMAKTLLSQADMMQLDDLKSKVAALQAGATASPPPPNCGVNLTPAVKPGPQEPDGLAGISFIPAPIPVGVNCDSLVLQGSGVSKGIDFSTYAFVVPRYEIGANAWGEKGVEFQDVEFPDPTRPETHIHPVVVTVYSPPLSGVVTQVPDGEGGYIFHGCDLDTLRSEYRKLKITNVTMVVPNRLEFSLPDIQGTGRYVVGDMDTNSLGSDGGMTTLRFYLTHPQFMTFRKQYGNHPDPARNPGVTVQVDVIFAAAGFGGSVDLSSKTQTMKKSLTAMAQAHISPWSAPELGLSIQKTVRDSMMSGDVSLGSDPAANSMIMSIAQNYMNSFTASLIASMHAAQISDSDASAFSQQMNQNNNNSNSNNSNGSSSNSGFNNGSSSDPSQQQSAQQQSAQQLQTQIDQLNSQLANMPPQDPGRDSANQQLAALRFQMAQMGATPSGVIPATGSPATGVGGFLGKVLPMVNAQVVAKAINVTSTDSINFTVKTAPKGRKHTLRVHLSGQNFDPGHRSYSVVSGARADLRRHVTGLVGDKGSKIEINFAARETEDLRAEPVRRLLSRADIVFARQMGTQFGREVENLLQDARRKNPKDPNSEEIKDRDHLTNLKSIDGREVAIFDHHCSECGFYERKLVSFPVGAAEHNEFTDPVQDVSGTHVLASVDSKGRLVTEKGTVIGWGVKDYKTGKVTERSSVENGVIVGFPHFTNGTWTNLTARKSNGRLDKVSDWMRANSLIPYGTPQSWQGNMYSDQFGGYGPRKHGDWFYWVGKTNTGEEDLIDGWVDTDNRVIRAIPGKVYELPGYMAIGAYLTFENISGIRFRVSDLIPNGTYVVKDQATGNNKTYFKSSLRVEDRKIIIEPQEDLGRLILYNDDDQPCRDLDSAKKQSGLPACKRSVVKDIRQFSRSQEISDKDAILEGSTWEDYVYLSRSRILVDVNVIPPSDEAHKQKMKICAYMEGVTPDNVTAVIASPNTKADGTLSFQAATPVAAQVQAISSTPAPPAAAAPPPTPAKVP